MSPSIMVAWPGAAPGMPEVFVSDCADRVSVFLILSVAASTQEDA